MTEDELDSDLVELIRKLRPEPASRLDRMIHEGVIYQGAWTPGRKENGSWKPGNWQDYGFPDHPVTIEPNFVILEQI